MAGWNLKSGLLLEENATDDRYWQLFNFVFSDACRKRNTYKFGLIKSILDNLFNATHARDGMCITYQCLFSKFAENYWNLVVKYGLKQMRPDGKSAYSRVEKIMQEAVGEMVALTQVEFISIDEKRREHIIHEISNECRKYVLGALYNDFEGTLYRFDLKDDHICIAYRANEFMLRHKTELERLNYYAWAKFLEGINDKEEVLVHLLGKLETSTPRRNDLSIYREILRREFEECNCFYCGKKIKRDIHVDHVIPWSFVKDDKLWNFVLSCPSCNEKKNNRVPSMKYVIKLEERNSILLNSHDKIIQVEFKAYEKDTLPNLWHYAKLSGIKEYAP